MKGLFLDYFEDGGSKLHRMFGIYTQIYMT
jgi:hypothetical protein